jgi:CBS domain-containing protein
MNIQHILATKGAHVTTIRPEQTIREALGLFIRHNIGALVVLDDAGHLIGLLSERDIIRAAPMNEAIFSQPVHEVMTRDPITAVPQDDLMSVANTMTEMRIRHLPVVDQGRLVGIVSIGDVVKTQRDQYRGEVETLQTQLLADDI